MMVKRSRGVSYHCLLVSSLIVLGLLVSAPAQASADQSSAATKSKAPKQIANGPDELAQTAFTITDLVLKEHIDPPTRQEMILAGLKAALTKQKIAAPELGGRVSELKTREELTALLKELWPKLTHDGKVSSKEVASVFVNGLLRPVSGNPHFLPAKEARVQGQFQANRYVGIGIALGMDEKTKLPVLRQVLSGGPAALGGLKAGDLIEQIDHKPVAPGEPLIQIVDRLRGPEGSELTLRIRHADAKESRMVALVRLPVMLKSVHGSGQDPDDQVLFLDQNSKIAYLKISAVNASTARELKSWEPRLREEGARALILDLRGARAGGEFDTYHAGLLLADALLDGQPLGKLQTRDGAREFTADREMLFRDWPLAILVDNYTGGAAEWVAAALQDAHPAGSKSQRAIIVGTPSSGDSFIRSAIPVPGSEDSLILATGVWARPNATRQQRESLTRSGDNRPPVEMDAMEVAGPMRPWRVIPDVKPEKNPFAGVANATNLTGIVRLFTSQPLGAGQTEKGYANPLGADGGRPAALDEYDQAAVAALRKQLGDRAKSQRAS